MTTGIGSLGSVELETEASMSLWSRSIEEGIDFRALSSELNQLSILWWSQMLLKPCKLSVERPLRGPAQEDVDFGSI